MNIVYGLTDHINGEVLLNNIPNNISLIDIKYFGSFSGQSTLPDNCYIMASEKRIICINLSKSPIDKLFIYQGNFMIKSCKIYDSNSSSFNLKIKKQGMDTWEKQDTNFEDFTQFPEDFNKIPKNNKSINQKTILVGNGVHQLKKLTSKESKGIFKFSNGKTYDINKNDSFRKVLKRFQVLQRRKLLKLKFT